MKNLNDFISEESKKKEKPHATKKGAGADDKQYVRLMEKYKRLRRGDREKPNEVLEAAKKLAKEGVVRSNAKIAGAYI